ncbi:MAG TPA: allantoinase AllB [Opitutaceae bacterium]
MSASLDLIVRGGEIVTPRGLLRADVGISGGRFVNVAPEIAGDAKSVIDASGKWVFPGIIDAHVHFNEPGRAEWEGLTSGPAALCAGGGTVFFDMPLNSEPPALNADALNRKRAIAEKKSCIDFALWGGLVPGNLDALEGLRDAGAIGLKAFMCASGIDSFPAVDDMTLREGMKRAAGLGMIVAVHAEDDASAARLTAEQRERGRTDACGWLDSRPLEIELAAIRTALGTAELTGCALHIVHVSSPEGIALVTEAKGRGVNVTAETCPHYLLLSDDDVLRFGAPAKCAPPLRDEVRRRNMWRELAEGAIDTVGSDHSPAPPEMKSSEDFFAIWGGIAGCQHGYELLFTEARARIDELFPRLAAVLAANVAKRFGLAGTKGEIAEDRDADLCIVEPVEERTIEAAELLTRHRISPYLGRRSRARIAHTLVRGIPVWSSGKLTEGAPRGQFLFPKR